jgi:hypothetical protein
VITVFTERTVIKGPVLKSPVLKSPILIGTVIARRSTP